MNLAELLIQKHDHYYKKLEDFLTKDETDTDLRIKKQMLFYFAYLLLLYFILIPIFSPYYSLKKAILALIMLVFHFLILKAKNYVLIVVFFLGSGLFSLYLHSLNHADFLRTIGVLICQHNLSLVTQNKTVKILFIIASIVLVNKSQNQLNELLEQNNIVKIKDAVISLQRTWPLLYLLNQLPTVHLTKRYCQAFHESHTAKIELEKANHELSELNTKLKHTLSLLENKNKELKDAISARELFIASVSHEIRNPLNSMIGNIELLSLEIKDSKWLKMLDTCKICGEVLLGLINNILDVAKINAERLDLNYQPINFYRFIEKVWVVSTIKMRQKGLRGELCVASDVPNYIEMDAHRLHQILLNLIGNATKFTRSGFVKVIITWHKNTDIEDFYNESSQEFNKWVKKKTGGQNPETISSSRSCYSTVESTQANRIFTISTDEDNPGVRLFNSNLDILQRTISVKLLSYLSPIYRSLFNESDVKIQESLENKFIGHEREKGVLKIEILDSGCGISDISIQRLFKPFSQADSSITRRFGGTGLGLYITKQLIEKMGGRINVESRENIGSDFQMVIPCQTATREETENNHIDNDCADNLVTKYVHSSVKALVVDDDPLNQMILVKYFKRLGIESEVANNGLEALSKVKAKQMGYYSFITMDLQMPVMDGLTASKQIRIYERQIRCRKNIPIIIVTGNCVDIDKNEWLNPYGEIRASYIFRKPFTFDECQSCIKSILAKGGQDTITSSRRLKVLIVDDDCFNTTFLKDYLEKNCFDCVVCFNGKEAVLQVIRQEFDIILMDCEMPEMDGYTATKIIRSKCPSIYIIGVTGDLREDCFKKARESGMNSIETKPVNFTLLISKMTKRMS